MMTQMIEYRTIDKSGWQRGPWDGEPDKVQWQDDATGLPCLIVRGPSGALCGYVGVSSGHPWHGVDYDNVGAYQPKPESYDEDWYVVVHGGLTFSDGCQHGDDPSAGICHIPAAGEPDDVWWLGFDCAHLGDKSGMAWDAIRPLSDYPRSDHGDVYRDVAYVKAECTKLAAQAMRAGGPA